VAAPLRPEDWGGPDALHDAIAAVHERWILQAPAAMEDPGREGAWEGGAGPGGWRRPPAGRPPAGEAAGALPGARHLAAGM
jgi:hypothetical protein